MEDFLQSLLDNQKRLYICTSKPLVFAQKILEHFHLEHFFHGIYGAELDGTRKNKGDVIAYCLEKEKLNSETCIMVGDRQHDIIGAHANHIPCIGVLYGYGNREEFENYQCDYIVQDLNELKGVIENEKKSYKRSFSIFYSSYDGIYRIRNRFWNVAGKQRIWCCLCTVNECFYLCWKYAICGY